MSRKQNLRRRGKKHQTRKANYNTIHPDRIIPDWPESIRQRLNVGDLEGDTVCGAVGKGAAITLVDRKTRYLCAAVVKSKNARVVGDTIIQMMKKLPVTSISFDNGSEFADFKNIEKELNAPIYFAEPHKPWQRGINENPHDILSFFYPKGYNFCNLSQEELDKVVSLINNRPRKCLGYLSP